MKLSISWKGEKQTLSLIQSVHHWHMIKKYIMQSNYLKVQINIKYTLSIIIYIIIVLVYINFV